MKKKLLILSCIICIIIAEVLIITSCTNSFGSANEVSATDDMFIVIESKAFYNIVYHRNSKVMYAVSKGATNGTNAGAGVFTVLVNYDGSPMIYDK